MDLVVNNIITLTGHSYIKIHYATQDSSAHFLQVKFIGDKKNINSLGAWSGYYYNRGNRQIMKTHLARLFINSPAHCSFRAGKNFAA